MFSHIKSVPSLLCFMRWEMEDCVQRNDYEGLKELHTQWASACPWDTRSFEEQELLLKLACEVLPELRKKMYAKPQRLVLKFS